MDRAILADTEISKLIHFALGTSYVFNIHRVPQGGDNQVWFINEDLALRINVDDDASGRQSRELLVREVVRQYCNNDPAIIPWSVTSGHWGLRKVPFCIETRIHGVSLDDISANEVTNADLALLLRGLKSIPLEALKFAGLEIDDDFDPDTLKQEALQAWQRLSINNQLLCSGDEPLSLDLSDSIKKLDAQQHPPVLLHADFKGEHILLDRETQSVVGVLDWTDVRIGHPATDIAGLAISLGSARATRIGLLAGYSDEIIQRAIFEARCEAVTRLDDRLNGDDDDDDSPVQLLNLQLKRALEPTIYG